MFLDEILILPAAVGGNGMPCR